MNTSLGKQPTTEHECKVEELPILALLIEEKELLLGRLYSVSERILNYSKNLNGDLEEVEQGCRAMRFTAAMGRIEETNIALEQKIEVLEHAARLLQNSIGR
jgi:hypothetical protein